MNTNGRIAADEDENENENLSHISWALKSQDGFIPKGRGGALNAELP